ncbi:MAG: NAD(P)/FAD-dependent oxidoreductase [Deltaproteobacteria bacterium]|nr:NAD(P)/FAD-dependent oxidoreductase [Deltaproteobacteria bacterium]
MAKNHHVVIIGGGFGGLYAAQSLANAPCRITLIDRRNFHLFQPLLYQVATGWLSPANIASTLRSVLKHQKNARVLLAEALDVDVEKREVVLDHGPIAYDTLIVGTGSGYHYFGNEQWRRLAPGLKTIEDATEIRRRILSALEAAERETDQDRILAYLTFMIVGGGPTGVELAGALGEIIKDTLGTDFRNLDPADAKIFLLEAADRILGPYPQDLSRKAENFLSDLGVTVRTNTMVTAIEKGAVTVKVGDSLERVRCETVLWAAGVKASPLGEILAKRSGARLDRGGRVIVEPDLSLPNHPEISVIGDLANFSHQNGQPLPGVAPVAMQQGRYVAERLLDRTKGKDTPPFRYKDRGNMAIIGRAKAVADLGRIRFAGFWAWLAWLFIHLLYLVEFQNRVLVLIQWGWYYFRRNRAARLITEDMRIP